MPGPQGPRRSATERLELLVICKTRLCGLRVSNCVYGRQPAKQAGLPQGLVLSAHGAPFMLVVVKTISAIPCIAELVIYRRLYLEQYLNVYILLFKRGLLS